MSPPLNVGVTIDPKLSTAQRFVALENAVIALDAALRALVLAGLEAGLPVGATNALAQAATALGLPSPPPLPSVLP